MNHSTTRSTRLVLSLLSAAIMIGGCGESRYNPLNAQPNWPDTTGGGGRDTVVINPGGSAGCGEITIEPFNVTRSDPLKYLRSYHFDGTYDVSLMVRVINYRTGGGHDNQNLQLYFRRDEDGAKVTVARPGDSCGVLADTNYVGAATRFVGQVSLTRGTWALYALHGSQVDCFSPTGSGNGPVNVGDGQLNFCPRR